MKRKIRKNNRTAVNTELAEVKNDKGLFDIREAAIYLGCTRQHVGLMLKRGHIVPTLTYYGNSQLLTKKELDNYNKKHVRDSRKGKRTE